MAYQLSLDSIPVHNSFVCSAASISWHLFNVCYAASLCRLVTE